MKQLFTILAIITSALAIIFSVLPISNLAIFPGIAALIFGGLAFYMSKKLGNVKKIIPFTLMLTAIALSLTTYKAFFVKTEVVNTGVLEAKEIQLEEEAIEELEGLEIEDTDIEPVEIQDNDISTSEEIENNDINASELENLDLSN